MSIVHEAGLGTTAAAQNGVFTRAQAIAAGFSRGQIERRVQAGSWCRVLPRVYRLCATPATNALSYRAAVLWCGPGCALSHASAAAIWRMPGVLHVGTELVVGRGRAPRAEGVVVHRIARFHERDVVAVGGLPVTTPVRTIIDLAGVLGAEDLARVLAGAESADLVTVRAVRRRLDELGSTGRPGAALLRTLLAPIGSVWVDRSARMAG